MKNGIRTTVLTRTIAGVLLSLPCVSTASAGPVDWLVRRGAEAARDTRTVEGRRYYNAEYAVDDVSLETFVARLEQFGLTIPVSLSGNVSAHLKIQAPLGALRDPKAYRFDGTATAPKLIVNGFEIRNAAADLNYRDGVLKLTSLRFQTLDDSRAPDAAATVSGSVSGEAALELVPRGKLAAGLSLSRVPLSVASELIPAMKDVHGRLTGRIDAEAPVDHLRELKPWKATGEITVENLTTPGFGVDVARTKLSLEEGRLTASEFTASLANGRIDGSAGIVLAAPFAWNARLQLTGAMLENLDRLSPVLKPPVNVSGRLEATANANGRLVPLRWEADGDLRLIQAKIANAVLETLTAAYRVDSTRIELSNFTAALYGGRVAGRADWSFQPDGKAGVAMKLTGVDVGRLAEDLGELPVRLNGVADGTLDVQFDKSRPDAERELEITAKLSAPEIRANDVRIGGLDASLSYDRRRLQYALTGTAFEGRLDLEGERRFSPTGNIARGAQQPPPENNDAGRLRLTGVQLARVYRAFASPQDGRRRDPVEGVVDVEFDFEHAAGDSLQPHGRGRVVVVDLKRGSDLLTRRIQGRLYLSAGVFQLHDVAGDLAGGRLQLAVRFDPARRDRSWFVFRLQAADAGTLGNWAGVDDGQVAGRLDVRLNGSLSRSVNASGEVTLSRARIGDAAVDVVRLPVRASVNLGNGGWRISTRSGSARIGGGRAALSLSIVHSYGLHVTGETKFSGVDLRRAFKRLKSNELLGGRINGTLKFGGRNIRALNDLTANLSARFEKTDAMELPVLEQTQPYLPAAFSTSRGFETGEVRARLKNGVVQIERFSLERRDARLYAEGAMTTGGRLDLEVTATTGNGNQTVLATVLLRQLATGGPTPVVWVVRANRFLANRTVHLQVMGTVKTPAVSVRPLPLLGQEGLRYLLEQAAG